MIEPLSHYPLQNGKYFSILKLIILQQNISTVWIFGDQYSWHQQSLEMNAVTQHLVGTVPKYVYDSHATKTLCVDNEKMKILNIFFVGQSFGSNELKCTCSTDHTMVLFRDNGSTRIDLPQKRASDILQRIVFGTIHSSDIADMSDDQITYLSLPVRRAEPMKDLFIERSQNLSATDFRVFFQMQPPSSMFVWESRKIYFIGPDAQLAYEASKMLNVSVLIQSDVGIEFPNNSYMDLFNETDPIYIKSTNALRNRARMLPLLPQHIIADYYANCSDYVDLCMSQLIKENGREISEFLYPHETKCLRIVVPHIKTTHRLVEKLSNNSIVKAICLVALIMFIAKILLNRSPRPNDWARTFFTVISILLGQSQQKTSTKLWEMIWNAQMIAIVIFSTAALSAISYHAVVSVKYVRQIDTLKDLIDSNLPIFVETSKESFFKEWAGNLDPRLRSKITYQRAMLKFVNNNTKDVAFIWEENMASFHIVNSEYFAPEGELPGMRIAKEPLYCGFSSLPRVVNGSPVKHSINTIFARMFESGIRRLHLDAANDFLAVSNSKSSRYHNVDVRPLTLSRIGDIFIFLIAGLSYCFVVFALEIFWNCFSLRVKWKILQRRSVAR